MGRFSARPNELLALVDACASACTTVGLLPRGTRAVHAVLTLDRPSLQTCSLQRANGKVLALLSAFKPDNLSKNLDLNGSCVGILGFGRQQLFQSVQVNLLGYIVSTLNKSLWAHLCYIC